MREDGTVSEPSNVLQVLMPFCPNWDHPPTHCRMDQWWIIISNLTTKCSQSSPQHTMKKLTTDDNHGDEQPEPGPKGWAEDQPHKWLNEKPNRWANKRDSEWRLCEVTAGSEWHIHIYIYIYTYKPESACGTPQPMPNQSTMRDARNGQQTKLCKQRVNHIQCTMVVCQEKQDTRPRTDIVPRARNKTKLMPTR